MRIPFISLVAAGALTLGGCAYGGYGSGVSFGVGAGGGGYYGDYGYGYGYGDPYFGWYDNFYYPGTGVYVYDRDRHPHAWNDRQRNYWMGRQQAWKSHAAPNTAPREDWSGFDHHGGRPHR